MEKRSAKVDRKARAQEDLNLWNQWNSGGQKPSDMRPLLKRFRPLIRSRANRYVNNVEMPPSAIHAEFDKQFVNALRTYNPTKGTQLGSWVTTNLQKAKRYVATYQNTARIGEQRIYKVGQYQTAVAELDDQLGRPPTNNEIAEHMGWHEREVERLGSEIRKTHISSAYQADPAEFQPSREGEVSRLIKFDLTPQERLVWEYTTGEGGKPKLRPGEIARKMNLSPSKVSRIRNSITRKVGKYSGGF